MSLRTMALSFLLCLLCSCSYLKASEKEITCFSWGQATCKVCANPITQEDGSIAIEYGSCPMIAESKGLSDNGLKAMVETIAGIPSAIVKAFLPFWGP